jgi:hypothetical protein
MQIIKDEKNGRAWSRKPRPAKLREETSKKPAKPSFANARPANALRGLIELGP